MAGFTEAGEWQLYSGYGFQMPPTDMLPKLTAQTPAKGQLLYYDKTEGTAGKWKITTGDHAGQFAICKVPAPLVADDPVGALRVEAWTRQNYVYTLTAAEALDPWGWVKSANLGKIAKWVSGTDTEQEKVGKFVQRPNVTPPQNSGKDTLSANGVDEVVGVLFGPGGGY